MATNKYPIEPSVFEKNEYQKEWFDKDYMYSQDGIKEFPQHHCKLTFVKSFPFIKKFRTAIDIGCRDGEYTRYLQNYFKHTFGFDARRREYFRYNVDLKKTTHFSCALGDEEGTISMHGGSHNHVDGKMIEHPVHKLDSFDFQDVDYMKIDVEGFEKKVLLGAKKTIQKSQPLIVIEQNDVCLPGEDPKAAKKWLESIGYKHVATCPRGWDYIMAPPTGLRSLWMRFFGIS